HQARLSEYYSQHKKLKKIVKSLEETIDWIENYIEEQTSLELGKILSDSDLPSYNTCELAQPDINS
ncbi:13003_t:CDS:1, partial [Gigaspora margarita]